MKILITEYEHLIFKDHTKEIEILKNGLGEDTEIEIFKYNDSKKAELIEKIKGADAVLTAFISLDKEVLENADKLKIISLNSTGYDVVDFEVANKKKIGVSPVGEYCTQDVSEGAIALAFALNKGLKHYNTRVEKYHEWNYADFDELPRMENSKVGIFGFGKIGYCTAKKLSKITKEIYAYDAYPISEDKLHDNISVKDIDYILENSDIIINHMSLTKSSRNFFNMEKFKKMKKRPIFINMSRGAHVVEEDLAKALDQNIVRAAGLDVLHSETPDLEGCPLLNRDNVIVTPHSSFWSCDSLGNLVRISTENIVNFLNKKYDKVNKLVNPEILK